MKKVSAGGVLENLPEVPSRSQATELVVGIATCGRPDVLASTIAALSGQERAPDRIIVAYAAEGDIKDAPLRFPGVTFVKSSLGLTRQRNAILKAVEDCDLLIFIDDDFYMSSNYLKITERLFLQHPDVVVATGNLLADGIGGPGLTAEQAKAILVQHEMRLQPAFNAYGCNMCLRMAPIREHTMRFDEELPLYGWYEDVDFSRLLARHGSVIKMSDACGVHLGVKSGRTSGKRLGYSQVANPIYLARKGSVSWAYAVCSIISRMLKNAVRSVVPESYVDRRGRLRGNLRAIRELLGGTLAPSRAANL